jgi:hypothetical protein
MRDGRLQDQAAASPPEDCHALVDAFPS